MGPGCRPSRFRGTGSHHGVGSLRTLRAPACPLAPQQLPEIHRPPGQAVRRPAPCFHPPRVEGECSCTQVYTPPGGRSENVLIGVIPPGWKESAAAHRCTPPRVEGRRTFLLASSPPGGSAAQRGRALGVRRTEALRDVSDRLLRVGRRPVGRRLRPRWPTEGTSVLASSFCPRQADAAAAQARAHVPEVHAQVSAAQRLKRKRPAWMNFWGSCTSPSTWIS